ncbi:sn1-specific diacylglycerol lipase beta-like isoform X2 [Limulus polyphemus]|uniref:sn-1-specific diacylglycerol lipase n=1 Tax=Limulus polyphemus TaxID=6850 RepID=A0ABM1TIQ0_LIMPO|nr:sn1-specific diacylglycerol lipase beta-like isoform X2 [Limulus polyphemus]
MPGLVACNRRWGIGSDDLLFPALFEIGIRMLWLCVVIGIFVKHQIHASCDGSELLSIYLIGVLVWLTLVIAVNMVIIWFTTKGSIIEIRPRQFVSKLLYFRLVLVIPEIAWTILGTLWAFPSSNHVCESKDVVIIVKIATILAWIMLLAILLGVFIVFDPLGAVKLENSLSNLEDDPSLYVELPTIAALKARQVWKYRMKLLCCCCAGLDEHSQHAYTDIASLFASLFEDVDLVPSDIVVGLVLLHTKQFQALQAASLTCDQPDTATPSSSSMVITAGSCSSVITKVPTQEQEWMTINIACHFMKFARGSYGWPMFMYSNIGTGLCQLWTEMNCCLCCRGQPDFVVDDNCCLCHAAALKNITGLKDSDLIYVSFHNRVYAVPFYVAIDHATSSIVVAIRGTLSLRDALTDLNAECEFLFHSENCPSGFLCHRGIYRAAVFVRDKLEESNALNDALALYQNYSLVITGHSLGAGTASVLAILLKQKYPGVRCFAFSPPGGLLSPDLAKQTEEFILSVMLGDDFVPRLSIPAIEELKSNLLQCILECDQPKVVSGILSKVTWLLLNRVDQRIEQHLLVLAYLY